MISKNELMTCTQKQITVHTDLVFPNKQRFSLENIDTSYTVNGHPSHSVPRPELVRSKTEVVPAMAYRETGRQKVPACNMFGTAGLYVFHAIFYLVLLHLI